MSKQPVFSFTPKEKTFTESVVIPLYRHGEVAFKFRFLSPEELKQRTEDMKDKLTVDFLDGVITGWDLKNDMGEELPYSREALDALLNALYCGNRIYVAFLEGLAGGREKN